MLRKVLVGVLAVVILASVALFFWARAVFTQESVRTALASQLSKSLGQPVTIGGIGATIYPRVTVNLRDVSIGEPRRIQVQTLHVGADFGALLSRRIEHAALRLTGARVELPLPQFAIASGAPPSPDAARPSSVELVSIDEIVLRDVDIVSGGRTLRGDVELVPQGKGVTVRKVTLKADDTAVDITGRIADLSGPTGDLTVKAGALNVDRLLAFVSEFANSAGVATSTPAGRSSPTATPMNLAVSMNAARATIGALTLESLSGQARITTDAITLQPIHFGLFAGNYDGSLTLTLGRTPTFRLAATLANVDMAAVTAFAGNPGTITGRLSGRMNVSGRGLTADSAMKSARGTARADITKGTVKRLGLVRTIVIATSGRADAASQSAGGSTDEPFTRLTSMLSIADGSATTKDLRFESPDLLLAAAGAVRLDGGAIDLSGRVQLSDALSKQAGRDLVRYTSDQGRVTLPVTITGSADEPRVRIDMADVAKRAVVNRASEEAKKAIGKGLGSLLKKR